MSELAFSQPLDFLNRTGRYALVGPDGATEIATCRGGGPTWLSHSATDRDNDGDDGCACDLVPSGRCWPDSGTVYPGPKLDAYLAGDAEAIEAALRDFYARSFAEDAS